MGFIVPGADTRRHFELAPRRFWNPVETRNTRANGRNRSAITPELSVRRLPWNNRCCDSVPSVAKDNHAAAKRASATIEICASFYLAAKEAWGKPVLPRPLGCNFLASDTARS